MTVESMIGRGRDAIGMIVEDGSFHENKIGDWEAPADLGPGAVVGEARLGGRDVVVIANDAQAFNERFPVVYFGVIGMEEAYKMAKTVYRVVDQDADKEIGEKRPLVLIVDTPGNGPGKIEEIFGMNKATGAYQLALAEARKAGHAVIALVIGRAISGAFLCHGLQADHILSLSPEFGTMIHVMPITSISRITKMDIERLEMLSKENPVFAAGPEFFYRLGGVDELVENVEDMGAAIERHIVEVEAAKLSDEPDASGPMYHGKLGEERGGRTVRLPVIARMREEFAAVADEYL
ncbi:MAG TPA: biotin-independent malonate decarboxylase subunit gamma [Rubneribacter badeniensis]|uniref:Biotin-independent malonate decarboxylase subunit gamma n=1 Tax=Rubneribacter badeniensis TaxID=2070688 RepID=A0A9D2VIW3_9ACTN|nr:biotin-independent malonate decarboxylase subunit gamma [Rubneribacter badeniensis]